MIVLIPAFACFALFVLFRLAWLRDQLEEHDEALKWKAAQEDMQRVVGSLKNDSLRMGMIERQAEAMDKRVKALEDRLAALEDTLARRSSAWDPPADEQEAERLRAQREAQEAFRQVLAFTPETAYGMRAKGGTA